MTTCFFALIIKNDTRIVQKINLNTKTKKNLSEEFEKQQTYFLNKKELEFTGTYKLEKGEIFHIENFTLYPEIEYILDSPTSCTPFKSVSTDESVKTIFAVQFLFQMHKMLHARHASIFSFTVASQ